MKKKYLLSGSIIGVVAFAWLSIAIVDFSIQLNLILQNKTYTTLEEISKQNRNVFESKLEEQLQILNTAGVLLAESENQTDGFLYHSLEKAAQIGGFDRVYSALPNGDAYFGSGIHQNIKEHEYFQHAILGELFISTPSISKVNGEQVIILAVPVKKEDQVGRVICGVYSLDKADKMFLESSYYGEGYGFIATSNGDLILGTANEKRLSKEKNLFSFFEKAEFKNGYSVEKLREDIEHHRSGSFSITYEGKERYASFTPTNVNDWYSLTFATNVILQRETESVSKIVLILTLKLVLAFIVIITYIVMIRRRHSKALNSLNQEYESLLSNVAGGVIRSTLAGSTRDMKAIYLSDSFTGITGFTMEDIQILFDGKTCGIIYEEDLEFVLEDYEKQVEEKDFYNLQYRVKSKSGNVLWVMDNGRVLKNKEINQSILVDITQMKEQEEELKLSEERFRIATRLSNGVIFEYDFLHREYTHFENAERVFGRKDEEFLEEINSLYLENEQLLLSHLYHKEDVAQICNQRKNLEQGKKAEYEARIRNKKGEYIWCRIFLYPMLNEKGKLIRSVGHIMDITQERERAERLKEQAQKDALTGVYNKMSCQEIIDDRLSHASRKKKALLMLDIDNFKGVNDTQGHAFGDCVLMEVGNSLNQLSQNGDIVGRIGGDEFVYFIPNYEDAEDVLKIAEEICRLFQCNHIGKKEDYKISCSIGIAFCTTETTFKELFEKADSSLYQAKEAGKDCYRIYED